ncbi:FG-GAP repeat domain-containing protein [Peredibacter sp. HCB2-198]|uniref:FG-GAP repeat domain-containing protein n=1 Tax=Peredibacter sp. HCB2-198 TaxID=3383025 RepID=UPI0038B59415
MGLLSLIVLGCSTPPKKSEDEQSIELAEELNSLSKKVQTTNYGPTVREGGTFADKTNDYGLNGLFAVTFNAVDFNFDGYTDLVILPTYYSRPKFYVFDREAKKFKPWENDPLPLDFKASFILIYDLNKDRVPDLLAGVLNQRSEISQIPIKLYVGSVWEGKLKFTEEPNAINLPVEPTSSLTILDYDLDGWADIFVSNWYENKNGQYIPVADRLLRNNKGKFEDVSSFLKGESDKKSDQLYPPNAKPTYGASICDIDQNGYPDIMTVSSSGHKNKLWMNIKEPRTGERFFDDLGPVTNYASDPDGSLIPTGGGRSFFSACTDYNDDGLMDIFVGELSHAYDNESVDKSSILTGSKETYPPYFIRTEYVSDASSESWNQGDRRAVWMDYNLDGKIDLVVDNSGFPPFSRLVLFEQDETRAFVNVGSQAGIDVVNPTGTIQIDVNRDGLPDILTSQNNIRKADIAPRLYLFENQNKTIGKKAIKVHLHGIKSNTEGIGAMVMLYTQSKNKKIVQRRWVEYTQGGLPSQNESGIHFGVPEGVEVVGVKVRWPYLRKSGYSSGEVLEKLYSLKGYADKEFVEVTVCEDGKILSGKMSCQF